MITEEAVKRTIKELETHGTLHYKLVANCFRELLNQQFALDNEDEKKHKQIMREIDKEQY